MSGDPCYKILVSVKWKFVYAWTNLGVTFGKMLPVYYATPGPCFDACCPYTVSALPSTSPGFARCVEHDIRDMQCVQKDILLVQVLPYGYSYKYVPNNINIPRSRQLDYQICKSYFQKLSFCAWILFENRDKRCNFVYFFDIRLLMICHVVCHSSKEFSNK